METAPRPLLVGFTFIWVLSTGIALVYLIGSLYSLIFETYATIAVTMMFFIPMITRLPHIHSDPYFLFHVDGVMLLHYIIAVKLIERKSEMTDIMILFVLSLFLYLPPFICLLLSTIASAIAFSLVLAKFILCSSLFVDMYSPSSSEIARIPLLVQMTNLGFWMLSKVPKDSLGPCDQVSILSLVLFVSFYVLVFIFLSLLRFILPILFRICVVVFHHKEKEN